MKKLLLFSVGFLVLIPLCIVPLACVGILFIYPAIREWETRQAIPIIEGADYLFEDTKPISNTEERRLFYWSSQPIEELRSYYQELNLEFQDNLVEYDSEKEGQWLFTAWHKSSTRDDLYDEEFPGNFLCHYRDYYECVDISLIDANHKEIIVGHYPRLFQESPSTGTLIKFRFYLPSL